MNPLALGVQFRHLEQLGDVVHNLELDLVRAAVRFVRRDAPRVKPCEQSSDGPYLLPCQLAPGKRAGERLSLVVAAHLDHVVDRTWIILVHQLEAAIGDSDPAHAQIDLRREPAVDADLLATHRSPPRRRAVVEERQHDFLLQLEGTRAPARNTSEIWVSRKSTRSDVRRSSEARSTAGSSLATRSCESIRV